MALLEEKERGPEEFGAGTEEGTGTLTVTADAVGQEIMREADPNMQEAIKVLVDAGMQVLFADEESHHAIFDGINTHDEVPIADELGTGAVSLAMQLLAETGGSEEAMAALVPAGTILLAKVFEFVQETNIAPVTDQDFSDAMEIFVVALEREVTQGAGGGEPMPPEQQQAPMPQQAPMSQQGGLLQQQGGM